MLTDPIAGVAIGFLARSKSFGRRQFVLSALVSLLLGALAFVAFIPIAPFLIGILYPDVAADAVLVPMTCDAYSIDGLTQICNFAEQAKVLNRKLDILGVVITRFRPRVTTNRIIAEELANHYGKYLFNTTVRECAAVSRAPFDKKDIFTYNRSCVAAKDYMALAGEVAAKMEGRV